MAFRREVLGLVRWLPALLVYNRVPSGSSCFVVDAPIVDGQLDFSETGEDLAIEAFISEFVRLSQHSCRPW